MIYTLLILGIVILLGLLGFTIKLLLRSLNVNRNFEEFYNSTLDDVGAITENLDELMHRRQIISDDPDVRKLVKTLNILQDILLGYQHAFDRNQQSGKDSNQ